METTTAPLTQGQNGNGRAHHTTIRVERKLTTPGVHPFDQIEWVWRDVETDEGTINAEFPASWSANACSIVAKKYFAVVDGGRETSVKQMIDRVATKIMREGAEHGYFVLDQTMEDENFQSTIFYAELCAILVNQLAAFNSPVWFNVGVPDVPQQCSACFILSIEDDAQSISDWYAREMKIFKSGSGSGLNISPLRGSMEPLSKGGIASGPVSFMRAADANAGTISSGGRTRRAAKLVRLDVDHPDVQDFIWCKAREEERLHILAAAGVNVQLGDEEGERNLAELTAYQNANNSIGVADEFMERATGKDANKRWPLRARKSGLETTVLEAPDLLDEIAHAAWQCADPGLQYDTTINFWHTTPAHGRINSSNPCSEYVSNDETSCNLSSINLVKMVDGDGNFDIFLFRHVVDIMLLAQEITVSFGDFPTEMITQRSRELRQLGLGYTNLGAMLMQMGIAYDSEDARTAAASITALMTGRAYRRSAEVAERMGAFDGYADNREAMTKVIQRHVSYAARLPNNSIAQAALEDWLAAQTAGQGIGYRNAQVTLLAPAGTISFLMDCDTTGIEPAFSLVSLKTLAGGGKMVLINQSVRRALEVLAYTPQEIEYMLPVLETTGVLPVKEKDQAVFASANQISVEGHMQMMACVQPFLSGAISKTINMPSEATVEDVRDVYVRGWELGLKAVAIYRDGCKVFQPLATKSEAQEGSEDVELSHPVRKRMPVERQSITHKFSVGGHEGYITAGLYEDGTLGEVFLTGIGKEGSTLQGMMGAWSIAVSIGLQYGVPLETLARKYSHMRFEPEGATLNPEIRTANSIVDYVMRWLASRFIDDVDYHQELGIMTPAVKERLMLAAPSAESIEVGTPPLIPTALSAWADAKTCECGGMMPRTGTCYTCMNCGANTGCG